MYRCRRFEDFDQEVQSHIEIETDRLISEGMDPEEARAAAIRTFGNLLATQERFYESHRIMWLDTTKQDIRYACRGFRKGAAFTLVAVFTLALGIGANTAIFSVVNAVLLRPLPFKNPERLVRIIENVPAAEAANGRPARLQTLTADDARELKSRSETLSDVALYTSTSMTLPTLPVQGETVSVQVAQVLPSSLSMLGMPPLIGRLFEEAEGNPGTNNVLIISYTAWQKYFAADRSILGRTLKLDDQEFAVVGVASLGFEFPSDSTEFWMPLVINSASPGQIRRFSAIARLKDNVSIEASAAEVNSIILQLRGVSLRAGTPEATRRAEVVRVKDEQVAALRPALLVLVVAVGFVLLIACTNVANLLLARAASRQREIAIRVALGAGRGRLIRQMLTESIILALAGGVLGTVIATMGTTLLTSQWPGNIVRTPTSPTLASGNVDWRVLAFTLAVSVLTGILFGLLPALRLSRTHEIEAIKDSNAAGISGARLFGQNAMRSILVIGEVTMAVILLVGAGLLIRSFRALSSVNPGFNPENSLVFQVALPLGPGGGSTRASVNESVIARLRSLPVVEAAGYSLYPALETFGVMRLVLQIPGVSREAMFAAGGPPRTLPVSAGYLQAVGAKLVAGRWITEADGPGHPPVMLVNREFVKRFFPDGDAIGKFVSSVGNVSWEIVGVIEDIRQRGLDKESEAQFFPEFRQLLSHSVGPSADQMPRNVYFVVRSNTQPAALVPSIRKIVNQLDSRAALQGVTTLEQVVSNSIAGPRFYALLLGIFGGVAVALASVGIYGIMAYSVTQRTREIGIRMALGAKRLTVLTLVLRQGFVLAGLGLAIGIGGAVGATHYLKSMLYGLTPLDSVTFAYVVVLFAAISLLASYVPARRATKVDPLMALRNE